MTDAAAEYDACSAGLYARRERYRRRGQSKRATDTVLFGAF